jgi:hypothetical protein
MDEAETGSEAPQLTEIAVHILNGLLASGDFTFVKLNERATGYGQDAIAEPRPNVVSTAIELAQELIEKTQS